MGVQRQRLVIGILVPTGLYILRSMNLNTFEVSKISLLLLTSMWNPRVGRQIDPDTRPSFHCFHEKQGEKRERGKRLWLILLIVLSVLFESVKRPLAVGAPGGTSAIFLPRYIIEIKACGVATRPCRKLMAKYTQREVLRSSKSDLFGRSARVDGVDSC